MEGEDFNQLFGFRGVIYW